MKIHPQYSKSTLRYPKTPIARRIHRVLSSGVPARLSRLYAMLSLAEARRYYVYAVLEGALYVQTLLAADHCQQSLLDFVRESFQDEDFREEVPLGALPYDARSEITEEGQWVLAHDVELGILTLCYWEPLAN